MSGKYLFLILGVLFLVSAIFFKNHLYTYHFVDEDEYILGGKLISQEEKIYQDFFAQHQPFSYFTSSALQKIFHPASLLQTIKVHRLFVFVWNTGWSVVLFFLAPIPTLLFVSLWDSVRFEIFGNLFLADSLVVYPILVCFLILIKGLRNKFTSRQLFLGILAIQIVFMAWQTGWMFVLFWCILLFLLYPQIFRQRRFYLLIFLTVLLWLPLIINIPLANWWQIIMIDNAADCPYVLGNCQLLPRIINGLTFPLQLVFNSGFTGFAVFEKILAGLFLINLFLLFKNRQWKLAIIMYFSVVLLGLRPLAPGQIGFNGFHKLPLLSLMLFGIFYTLNNYLKLPKLMIVGAWGLLLIGVFLAKPYLWQNIDPNRQYHVFFSNQEKAAKEINNISRAQDTLFVMPDEMLIYYLAGAKHASKYVYYFEWMCFSPKYRQDLKQLILNSPPSIIYSDVDNRVCVDGESKILTQNYTSMPSNEHIYLRN